MNLTALIIVGVLVYCGMLLAAKYEMSYESLINPLRKACAFFKNMFSGSPEDPLKTEHKKDHE